MDINRKEINRKELENNEELKSCHLCEKINIGKDELKAHRENTHEEIACDIWEYNTGKVDESNNDGTYQKVTSKDFENKENG
jgi:hypothetical protein